MHFCRNSCALSRQASLLAGSDDLPCNFSKFRRCHQRIDGGAPDIGLGAFAVQRHGLGEVLDGLGKLLLHAIDPAAAAVGFGPGTIDADGRIAIVQRSGVVFRGRTRDGAAQQRADEIRIQGKRPFVLGQGLLRGGQILIDRTAKLVCQAAHRLGMLHAFRVAFELLRPARSPSGSRPPPAGIPRPRRAFASPTTSPAGLWRA